VVCVWLNPEWIAAVVWLRRREYASPRRWSRCEYRPSPSVCVCLYVLCLLEVVTNTATHRRRRVVSSSRVWAAGVRPHASPSQSYPPWVVCVCERPARRAPHIERSYTCRDRQTTTSTSAAVVLASCGFVSVSPPRVSVGRAGPSRVDQFSWIGLPVCVSFLFDRLPVVWFSAALYTETSVPIASGAVGAHLPSKYVTVRCVYFFLPPAAAGAVVWFRRRRLAASDSSPPRAASAVTVCMNRTRPCVCTRAAGVPHAILHNVYTSVCVLCVVEPPDGGRMRPPRRGSGLSPEQRVIL